MLKNSSILITGGTGSFGHSFVPLTLKKFNPRRLVIFSRDEMKQWEMEKLYKNDPRVRFFIGDVRDKDRLHRALYNIDFVVHAAATKIVPTAEYNPFECIKTNINGAMNLIDACIDQNVKKVVAISTDKASSPINLYGATKLASDKLFTASSSSYAGGHKTIFSVVRYGNVMGSRGSVIPLFVDQIKKSKNLTITDPNMTRFLMSLDDSVNLVMYAFEHSKQGDIFVQKAPASSINNLATALCEIFKSKNQKINIIGTRHGEKLYETLVSREELARAQDLGDFIRMIQYPTGGGFLVKHNDYDEQYGRGVIAALLPLTVKKSNGRKDAFSIVPLRL